MTSILKLETRDLAKDESRVTGQQDPGSQAPGENAEYEIVLGRAQIASWLFVGIIAIAICSSLAYLAGKKIAADNAAAISLPTPPPPPPAPPISAPARLPEASVIVNPQADSPSLAKSQEPSQPLFAEPEKGKVYIQIGAVERGMAMLLAEGLQSHGFQSFVGPGPNDKVFRVLIGPLPDPTSFRQAMVTVNALDLSNFARKYQK